MVLVGCEDHVCQNVILNLDPGIIRDMVGVMMSLVIVLSYILILAPAREHIERMLLRYSATFSCFHDFLISFAPKGTSQFRQKEKIS